MVGPITLGLMGSGKVNWVNYQILCKYLLGYIPEPDAKLTKAQLHALGFLYAAGTKKFTSGCYGRIDLLYKD